MTTARVFPLGPRPDSEFVARFGRLPAAVVSDAMGRRGGAPGILPIPHDLSVSLAGPAFTVSTRAGDNLVVHKALDMLCRGDVLVIDAGGHVDRAILGEIIVRYAARRGAAGLVVDGAVRDVARLPACGVPVFAHAPCHVGPFKDGPGALHGVVSIAGTPVHDGDIVVGDADGLVFVPAGEAAAVLQAAEATVEAESAMLEAIQRDTLDRAWVDERLTLQMQPREQGMVE